MGLFDFFKRKKMPATIEAAMQSQSRDFVDAFSGAGSPIDAKGLDFSEASLELVDEVLHDFYLQEAPLPDDLHFLASAYIFETARQQFGGRYLRGDAPDDFILAIGEPEFQVTVFVMSKVRNRTIKGPEDNIPFFYAGIAPLVARKANAMLV